MEDMNIQLPTELVERAVRDKISAAIAAQLGDPEEMIKKLVSSALSQKVNASGVVSNRSYDNEFEFLELLMGKFIRDAAKEALIEFMEENKGKIKDAVKKEVSKSPSKMAKVFMDGLMDNMSTAWRTNIDIRFDSTTD